MSSRHSHSSNYGTIVRKLEESPSTRRRKFSNNNNNNSTYGSKYSSSYRSFDANSTFDSSTVNEIPSKSINTSTTDYHTVNNDYDFDEYSKKQSIRSDPVVVDSTLNSKTINNTNYSSLSDGENEFSECGNSSSAEVYKSASKICDKYGFFIECDEEDNISQNNSSQEIKMIRTKEKKWLQMLHNWRFYINFKWEKIRDRCRKGIPHSLRSQAWFFLVGAQIQKKRYPHLYKELLTKNINEEVRMDIVKDLDRQFPNHEMFVDPKGSGQADLYNVLKAFAVYRPKVGYCQAEGPIAAVLLMHMPAEHAFWCLVALNDYYIGGYFLHNIEDIPLHGAMLFTFVKKYSPNAYSLLKRQNIDPVLYMTEWFMCIYSRTLPWASVLRVWDMFLCEGVSVLFKVGIYLVDVALKHESTKTCPSMYETCQKLRQIPKEQLTEVALMKGLKAITLKDSDLMKEHKVQFKKLQKAKKKQQQQQQKQKK